MEKFAQGSLNETTATTAAAETETKAKHQVSLFYTSDNKNHFRHTRVFFRKYIFIQFYPSKKTFG